MKTAVDRVGSGKARQVNARFLAMTSHYVFEPEFCNPAAGWEKGQVEKNVLDTRRLILQLMPDFPDLAALNAWLEQRCIEQWEHTPHGTLPGTVAEVWRAEKSALMPTPPAFDGFVEQSKRVSPTCLISFERNRYSVPAAFANRPVSLRIYPDRLVVAAEGRIVCEHPRVIQRSHKLPPRTIYDWRHYLAVIQRKPGALRNGAPFAELPESAMPLARRSAVVSRTSSTRQPDLRVLKKVSILQRRAYQPSLWIASAWVGDQLPEHRPSISRRVGLLGVDDPKCLLRMELLLSDRRPDDHRRSAESPGENRWRDREFSTSSR